MKKLVIIVLSALLLTSYSSFVEANPGHDVRPSSMDSCESSN